MNSKEAIGAQGTVSQILTKAIDGSKQTKSQRELAQAMGYEKPNILSMMKRGESRVPLDKVPVIARVLGLDPGHLFRLCVAEYNSALYEALHDIFGNTVSKNEMEMVSLIRSLTNNLDPELDNALRQKLVEFFRDHKRGA